MVVYFHEQVHPSHMETTLEEHKLEKIDFPVLFKLCFRNSFNIEKLNEAGYSSVSNYFKGKSSYNDSIYGWAGHGNDSVSEGVLGKNIISSGTHN